MDKEKFLNRLELIEEIVDGGNYISREIENHFVFLEGYLMGLRENDVINSKEHLELLEIKSGFYHKIKEKLKDDK